MYQDFFDKTGAFFHKHSDPLEEMKRLDFSPFQIIDKRYESASPEGAVYCPVLFKHQEGVIISILEPIEGGYKEVPIGPEFSLGEELKRRGFEGFESVLLNFGNKFYCPTKVVIGGEKLPYCLGIYEQWLFSVGVDSKNNSINEEHPLYGAYLEYKTQFQTSPLVSSLKRDNFFEYQLSLAFSKDSNLKARALQSVEFIVTPMKYYNETYIQDPDSGDLKASRDIILTEDLVLSYYFSSMLQKIYAACVGLKAFNDIVGIAEIEGALELQAQGGFPDDKVFISHAMEKKFSDGEGKFSFMDVWEKIKIEILGEGRLTPIDFFSFSGHGVVLVFGQEEFFSAQPFEYGDIARLLGFNIIDSYHAAALNPFYKCIGKEEDSF